MKHAKHRDGKDILRRMRRLYCTLAFILKRGRFFLKKPSMIAKEELTSFTARVANNCVRHYGPAGQEVN